MRDAEQAAPRRMRVHIVVRGLVQGVSFRYATVSQGRRLGLLGWTRNMRDGNVEVVAEGEPEKVRELIAWCHTGPPSARVASLEHSELPLEGRLDEFQIRW